MIDLRYGRCCLQSLREMPDASVHCVVTSPPYYGLRNYGIPPSVWGGERDCGHEWGDASWRNNRWGSHDDDKPGQKQKSNAGTLGHRGAVKDQSVCKKCGAWRGCFGNEPTVAMYVSHAVEVFDEVRRVLRDDGTLWLNLGDSYASGKGSCFNPGGGATSPLHRAKEAGNYPLDRGSKKSLAEQGIKSKDLYGVPWMVAFALRSAGWYLRMDVVWCLSGGTQLYTRTQKGDMRMSVKDVVRLDPSTVKLWNGEKWTQVLGFSQSSDPRQALEIELRSGECIGCTPGHQWPTQRGNVRTDELKPGDVIRATSLPEPDAPINAEALDDDVAWLCGLYLAEGSMSGETVQLAGHANQSEFRLSRLESIAKRFHGTSRVHTDGNSASICMDGPVIASVIRAYVHGNTARNKGLKSRTWQRSNSFLRALMEGYLSGDGHHDKENGRHRLGFTRNDRLADDLRTLAARLGLSMRLAKCKVSAFGRTWPAYKGDIRLERTEHFNARKDGEVVAVRPSKGRKFWDIGVEDEPHLFALASGILTHNSKPNPMPESVEDRPTRSHEYLFLLSKSDRYFYDGIAIAEPSVTDDIRRPYGSEGAWLMDGRPEEQRPNGKPRGKGGKKAFRGENGPANREGRDMQDVGAGKTRNKRSVWTVPVVPFPGAHFATFPPALIEPCILAGTSAKGCCPKCGAQWRRVTESVAVPHPSPRRKKTTRNQEIDTKGGNQANGSASLAPNVTTLGWEPTCDCGDTVPEFGKIAPQPIPCTVLDPFSGSGTTCANAMHLGRNSIGLDASKEYEQLARERCGGLFLSQPNL